LDLLAKRRVIKEDLHLNPNWVYGWRAGWGLIGKREALRGGETSYSKLP